MSVGLTKINVCPGTLFLHYCHESEVMLRGKGPHLKWKAFPCFYFLSLFYGARELWADGPIVVTCGLFHQGPSAQKRTLTGHRRPDAASLGMTSSTLLMRPCTALQGAAVTSWLGTANNAPSPFSVSPRYPWRDLRAGAAEVGEGYNSHNTPET